MDKLKVTIILLTYNEREQIGPPIDKIGDLPGKTDFDTIFMASLLTQLEQALSAAVIITREPVSFSDQTVLGRAAALLQNKSVTFMVKEFGFLFKQINRSL